MAFVPRTFRSMESILGITKDILKVLNNSLSLDVLTLIEKIYDDQTNLEKIGGGFSNEEFALSECIYGRTIVNIMNTFGKFPEMSYYLPDNRIIQSEIPSDRKYIFDMLKHTIYDISLSKYVQYPHNDYISQLECVIVVRTFSDISEANDYCNHMGYLHENHIQFICNL